ncbi:efflux RND transporter periplasmic adaptor subunit [uncultured Treponema sp.]|uniref:efflux RND transporter periplasmic adaptor subunit n=1 Tax=uncultured Treponema sp. TaxID=162155 RepID=UPI0025DDDA61|nr:efflux RND transporter periplasmic adaptor subunit [uncultured Treponema sp.]
MKITKKRLCYTAGAMVLLGIVACLPKRKMEMPPVEKTVYPVQLETVQKSDLQEYLLLSGNVKADNTISVFPDMAGKLVNVPVTLGSYVKKGQVIAEVDPSVPGSVYAKSPVYAPIEGYITSLPLTPGTTVSTSTEIARIGNIKNLQIESKVPEGKIGVLKNNLTAEISLEAYKNETFPAHIFRISPIVDETSRTKEVYFLFDTNDSRINAGMYVRIKLNTILHKNIISVPSDCIVTESGKKYIYVASSQNEKLVVEKRGIEEGVTVDARTEITAGLNENEEIVVSGMQVLSDGAEVRDVNKKTAQQGE